MDVRLLMWFGMLFIVVVVATSQLWSMNATTHNEGMQAGKDTPHVTQSIHHVWGGGWSHHERPEKEPVNVQGLVYI